MKKIWFFGDSWCCSSEPGTWVDQLAIQTNSQVAHLGFAGKSLHATMQDFINNIQFIQSDDIVVFVYTSIFRWRFKNNCYRQGVSTLKDQNQGHQNITKEQFDAYNRYLIYLSDPQEEELRAASYISYMYNYPLPCKTIHIPAFGDFPIDYIPGFKSLENIGFSNTGNLTSLIWQFEKNNAFPVGTVSSSIHNHMGEPGTVTDAVPYILENIEHLLDK